LKWPFKNRYILLSFLMLGTSRSDMGSVLFQYESLVSVLGYFSEIINDYSAEKGICILIDGRKMSPKALKNVLRACQQAFYHRIRMAIIVQPDKFFHQQKINFDLIMEGYEFRTLLVSLHKLSKYIDISQLPEIFGGTFTYDAEKWCDDREVNLLHRCIRLFIHLLIKHLASLPQKEAELSKITAENEERCRMLEEHAEGVNRLLDWIEGPGEKWLLTLHEIGENKDEARQLVKEHQQLALKSKEIVSQADELAELASRLMAAVPAHSITLEKAREQVRALARQYANRVERQTGMARQSEEFHTRVSDVSRLKSIDCFGSEKLCLLNFEGVLFGNAIKWLEELHDTLLKDYNQMGCADEDLRHLREDRMKLEETARSTYEYGRQLCQVALVLRRSLRMDVKNQVRPNPWTLFTNHYFVVLWSFQVNHRIDELGQRVNEVRDSQLSPEKVCAVERRRLNNDIQELRHIADMLIAQVNANHNVTPEARQAAILSIRRKVDGVDSAHRRMESLFVETAASSRSQSLHRLSIGQQSPSEESPRQYYHATGTARRPSGQSLPPAQPVGSIRLSDTESYL
uniref:CRAL-TRIO domain-containing protein n=1 Tax=Haemonchus placei TaxID=6290 RepID=A0A158QR35_HAEPC